jgi:NAD-dependent DNA ligase
MLTTESLLNCFNRARIDDRQINELIGLCRGLVADGAINAQEIEYLQKWLAANNAVSANPIVATLYDRVRSVLHDGVLDSDEAKELLETLVQFSGSDFELGEVLKSTTLPLDMPPPRLAYEEKRYCFTGSFAFGSRSECEKAVTERHGEISTLTRKTDYLVIGVYATESWAHSTYGRKIEKALELKRAGSKVAIIHEPHWVESLQ